MLPHIPLLKPNPPKPEQWLPYLEKSYATSTFSNGGPNVTLLEDRLKNYLCTGEKPVLMCNATIALTVALRAFGLEGSEVLMPSFTFMATAHSVLEAKCEPVLVDTDQFLELDLEDAERKITSKTKALVVVHALGYVTDYKRYEAFSKKHGLKLIFDSAAALGARYEDGSMVGSAGDCEVFSLHITKTFGVGEGALVSSKDHAFLEKCRKMINFGIDNGFVETWGTNAKMSEIHAAIGLAVFDNLGTSLELRQSVWRAYWGHFFFDSKSEVQGFNKPTAHQVFPLLFDTEARRNKVVDLFKATNIGHRIYYVPIHVHNGFKVKHFDPTLSKTEELYRRILCIPFFETMTVAEMGRIVTTMELAWT